MAYIYWRSSNAYSHKAVFFYSNLTFKWFATRSKTYSDSPRSLTYSVTCCYVFKSYSDWCEFNADSLYAHSFSYITTLQIILQIIFILGDGRCTVWSSSKIRSSFQAIISCDQRKSFKNMISAFSVPSQAYLSLVGLLKVINIFCNGNNKNVLPQLSGPTIKMFLNLPLPLLRSSLMAGAKATHSILFPWRTSRA